MRTKGFRAEKHLEMGPSISLRKEVDKGRWGMLSILSCLWWVNCQPCGVFVRLVFGLQVHGRRVSTGSCRGGAVVDGPCGGRRWRAAGTGARTGRQLWRPLLDRGRKRRRKAGFLVCATKPRRRTAVEDAKWWRHGRRSRDWRRRRASTASRASLRARRWRASDGVSRSNISSKYPDNWCK